MGPDGSGNPVLDEIMQAHASLSPAAQKAVGLAAGSSSAAPVANPPIARPLGGAPLSPIHAATQAPPAGIAPASTQMPEPPPQLGTVRGDTDERQRLLTTGPGSSQIHNPFARGLATVGDTLLSRALPGLASAIPGTTAHHDILLRQTNTHLGQDIGNEGKEAQTAETQARIPLTQAQTQKTQEETAEMPGQSGERERLEDAQIENLLHPQAKTAFEAWRTKNPDADPLDFVRAENQSKAVQPKEQLQRDLLAAQAKGDTVGAKKIQQQLKDIDPMGEQRLDIELSNAGNAQRKAADATTEKEFSYYRSKWDKDLGTYNTQNGKLSEAADMVGKGSMGAALGSVKSLSGLAAGQGSGVRITQAELNSIARARGLGGDFEAALQKFGDGNKLTPEQVQALKGIISDVQRVAAAKEAVINQGLDDLGSATDTKTIRKIDSQLRHVLMAAQ